MSRDRGGFDVGRAVPAGRDADEPDAVSATRSGVMPRVPSASSRETLLSVPSINALAAAATSSPMDSRATSFHVAAESKLADSEALAPNIRQEGAHAAPVAHIDPNPAGRPDERGRRGAGAQKIGGLDIRRPSHVGGDFAAVEELGDDVLEACGDARIAVITTSAERSRIGRRA